MRFALALVVAIVATSGSLYLSEVAHFIPCRLCWYQRAAMYPLVPLLAVSLWRRWFGARWVVFAIAVVGGSISVWHILIERFPTLETGACDPDNPCSLIWVRRLGYLTIPTMALSAFALDRRAHARRPPTRTGLRKSPCRPASPTARPPRPGRAPSRRLPVILITIGIVVVLAVVAALASRGGDDDPTTATTLEETGPVAVDGCPAPGLRRRAGRRPSGPPPRHSPVPGSTAPRSRSRPTAGPRS